MDTRPNILLILVDDMGYSDPGCFGGEIDTPNLDRLAAAGQAHTQFYNLARCCPSRASLLTGLHPHQTGIGYMTNTPVDKFAFDRQLFGYRGFLNHSCVTMAEVLRDGGYHTWLCGKWHLGQHEYDQHPVERGFDRFYGILAGAVNYFKPAAPQRLFYNHEPEESGPGYYTTNAFTDYALKFIKEKKDKAPFFLYLAYNAPHWPLQAPEELVKKYRGKYRRGWDKLREERYRRMIKKGIIGGGCALSPRDPEVRPWEELDEAQKDEMDYRMAVYAAQVERVDENIGRLTSFLESRGELDNTLIFFLSDNGACAEGGELGRGSVEQINNAEIPNLMVSYGRAWANASNTPFRMFKHYVHEGGIATPLIVHWPAGIKRKGFIREPGQLIDLMPTVVDVSGASYPARYHGCEIPPLEGISLRRFFEKEEPPPDRYLFWEHEENCGVRFGRYKALEKYDTGIWELYDLEEDRSETKNIAAENSELLAEMSRRWYDWAVSHHVVPKWKIYP
jgi:arylsulfatase